MNNVFDIMQRHVDQPGPEIPWHWNEQDGYYIVCNTTDLWEQVWVASRVAKREKVQRACSVLTPKVSTTSGTHSHPKSKLGMLLMNFLCSASGAAEPAVTLASIITFAFDSTTDYSRPYSIAYEYIKCHTLI